MIDRIVRSYEALARSDRVFYHRHLAVDWARCSTFRQHLNGMQADALAALFELMQSNGDLIP